MIVYNYDSITNEYTGYCNAYLDPAETKAQGKDVYLIPAYATDKKPPKTKEHQTVIFVNNKWEIVADYRGCMAVDNRMIPIQIENIGDLPEGYVIITLEQLDLLAEYGHLYFIIVDGELVVNPNYEEDKRREEEQGWQLWHMTKYDFFKYVCTPYGITYSALNEILATSDEIAAAWNLCAYVYLGDGLLTNTVKHFIPEITDEILKEIFYEHRVKEVE